MAIDALSQFCRERGLFNGALQPIFQYLGAEPAFLCALHTWGRSLALHPHLHCLITEGGVTVDSSWKNPQRACFLPARVVMALFRGKFLAYVREALHSGNMKLPEGTRDSQVINLLNKLGRKKRWNVNVRERYTHGDGVAKYLARYVRGGPLKNSQLHHLDATHITYRYYAHDDNPDGKKRHATDLTLTHEAFIARYLNHIPPSGQHVVRAYGGYANAKLPTLNVLREQFAQPPVTPPPVITALCFYAQVTGKTLPTCCSQCGAALKSPQRVPYYDWARWHAPPTTSPRLYE